jgi:carbon-monoxide dehydrogenase medium subunit
MIPFDLAEPRTIAEAVALLDADDPAVRPMAGGTALMLMMKSGVFQPSRLVSLEKIERDYARISLNADGALRIGAMTPLSALEHAPDVARAFPVITQTLRTLANVRVRNVARFGGCLAHGDPHMDLPPVFSALGAKVRVVGPASAREIHVEDLYVGYYETVLQRNELIAEVVVPPLNGRRAAYLKLTTRSADDWPALGIAASLHVEDGAIRDASIVVSAATEKVTRLAATERALKGAAIEDAALRRAGEAAASEAECVADARGSAAYKRELIRVCVGRVVRTAAASNGTAT